MIPGSGGVTGQVEDVGHVFAGIEGNGPEVQHGRDQHDAIEVQAVMRLQVVRERGGAEGTVAFTNEKFRVDELRQGFDVLIDAPEVLVLRLAHGVAEARSDGVKEYQICFVEEAVRILGELIGSGRRGIGVHGDHAARRKRAHVQPYGGRARAAVVDERDGALAEILHVAACVSGVIEQRSGFILFIFQENGCCGRFIGNVLAADLNAVIGDGRFFFGRRGGGSIGGLVGRFGILILRARCRSDRGHG